MREWREAARALYRTPMVAIVAILSLALGVGATTAIYSIVDSLILRPLPVAHPEQLVTIVDDKGWSSWSNPVWEQIRDRRDLFAGALAWGATAGDLTITGDNDPIEGLWVSGDYFRVLGVKAAKGRLLESGDDRPGGGSDGRVAVISADFWQRRFGGASDIVGRQVTLDGVPFTIVGVTAPSFFGTLIGSRFEVAVPLGAYRAVYPKSTMAQSTTGWLTVMARLRPGQTPHMAALALGRALPEIKAATLGTRTGDAAAAWLKHGMNASPVVGGSFMRDKYRSSLYTLLGVVALVLLIACANIANLLMVRANSRQHELTVRAAMGAAPSRLARQLLIESVILAGIGTTLALGIARWSSGLLVRQLSMPGWHVFLDLSVNLRVLGFTLATGIVTVMIFGVAPALRSARIEPMEVLRKVGRGSNQVTRSKFATILVVAQIAFSLMLVDSAGLFVRTFSNLENARLGIEPSHVLIAKVNAGRLVMKPADRPAFYERIRETLGAIPGVRSVGASRLTPLDGSTWMSTVKVSASGDEDGAAKVAMNMITPDWFGSYGAGLIEGRDFDTRDVPGTGGGLVAIVNQTFVRTYLHGDPVGQIITLPGRSDSTPPVAEIIGVSGDAVYRTVREAIPPTVYVSAGQQPQIESSFAFGVRVSNSEPESMERAITAALLNVDPQLQVKFRTLTTQIESTFAQERLLAMLSAAFGTLALFLAALGLYGVTSHAVSQRRNELGVRMALGSSPLAVVGVVVRRVGWQVASGVAIGIVATLVSGRFVASLLYAITPVNVTTFGESALVLALAGLLACVSPARRVFTIDPVQELRAD